MTHITFAGLVSPSTPGWVQGWEGRQGSALHTALKQSALCVQLPALLFTGLLSVRLSTAPAEQWDVQSLSQAEVHPGHRGDIQLCSPWANCVQPEAKIRLTQL